MEARRKKGLSQQELAQLIGKSLRTVQNYEAGVSDFPISTLTKLAKCLDCTLEDLLFTERKLPTTVEDAPAPAIVGTKLKHLDDLFSCFFELNNKLNVEYTLEFSDNTETNEHSCAIRFTTHTDLYTAPKDEPEIDAKTEAINKIICRVMKQFDEIRKKFASGDITWNEYEYWCTSTMAFYPMITLKSKAYDEEPSEQLIQMRETLAELRQSCLVFEYCDEMDDKRQKKEAIYQKRLAAAEKKKAEAQKRANDRKLGKPIKLIPD